MMRISARDNVTGETVIWYDAEAVPGVGDPIEVCAFGMARGAIWIVCGVKWRVAQPADGGSIRPGDLREVTVSVYPETEAEEGLRAHREAGGDPLTMAREAASLHVPGCARVEAEGVGHPGACVEQTCAYCDKPRAGTLSVCAEHSKPYPVKS